MGNMFGASVKTTPWYHHIETETKIKMSRNTKFWHDGSKLGISYNDNAC